MKFQGFPCHHNGSHQRRDTQRQPQIRDVRAQDVADGDAAVPLPRRLKRGEEFRGARPQGHHRQPHHKGWNVGLEGQSRSVLNEHLASCNEDHQTANEPKD